jgi:hypothetical protein
MTFRPVRGYGAVQHLGDPAGVDECYDIRARYWGRNKSRNMQLYPFSFKVLRVKASDGWIWGAVACLREASWCLGQPNLFAAVQFAKHIGLVDRQPWAGDHPPADPLLGHSTAWDPPDDFPLRVVPVSRALHDMVKLPPAEFVSVHGLRHARDLIPPEGAPDVVLTAWQEVRNAAGGQPFAFSELAHEEAKRRLRGLLAINKAWMEATTPAATEAVYERAEEWGLHSPEAALEPEILDNLQGMSVGVHLTRRERSPFMATTSTIQAIYAHIWRSYLRDSPLRTCQRRDCDEVFESRKASKRFCSERCEQIDKQRRYNARLRERR